MKNAFFIIFFLSFFSCSLSVEKGKAPIYKPGFGALMGTIQTHHAKLWFAGINKNWQLAEFELHEISETIEDLEKYQKDRKETQALSMIFPFIETTKQAVVNKDSTLFVTEYSRLTQACNTCHKDTNYEYICIKNPVKSSFSNQDFELK